MKVARSQHIQFQALLIEQTKNPLPKNLQESLPSIMIPFFYVVGMKVRFYVLFQINGDLYGVYEWASEDMPIKDIDFGEVVLLCRRFLVHRWIPLIIYFCGFWVKITGGRTGGFRIEWIPQEYRWKPIMNNLTGI